MYYSRAGSVIESLALGVNFVILEYYQSITKGGYDLEKVGEDCRKSTRGSSQGGRARAKDVGGESERLREKSYPNGS